MEPPDWVRFIIGVTTLSEKRNVDEPMVVSMVPNFRNLSWSYLPYMFGLNFRAMVQGIKKSLKISMAIYIYIWYYITYLDFVGSWSFLWFLCSPRVRFPRTNRWTSSPRPGNSEQKVAARMVYGWFMVDISVVVMLMIHGQLIFRIESIAFKNLFPQHHRH